MPTRKTSAAHPPHAFGQKNKMRIRRGRTGDVTFLFTKRNLGAGGRGKAPPTEATLANFSLGEKVRYLAEFVMVGALRFELRTPCSQSRCATSLRHTPKAEMIPIRGPPGNLAENRPSLQALTWEAAASVREGPNLRSYRLKWRGRRPPAPKRFGCCRQDPRPAGRPRIRARPAATSAAIRKTCCPRRLRTGLPAGRRGAAARA